MDFIRKFILYGRLSRPLVECGIVEVCHFWRLNCPFPECFRAIAPSRCRSSGAVQCRPSVADVVQQLSVADSLSREGTGASSSYCRPPVVPPVLQLKQCFKLSNLKYKKLLQKISHNSSRIISPSASRMITVHTTKQCVAGRLLTVELCASTCAVDCCRALRHSCSLCILDYCTFINSVGL